MKRCLAVLPLLFFLCACSDADDTGTTGTPTGGTLPTADGVASPVADTSGGGTADVSLDEGLPGDLISNDAAANDAGPEMEEPPPCEASCTDKECGTDGCGGTCGSCTGTDICSEAGTCDPDPQAGCGGLELAEDWSGTFEGVYDVTVVSGLIPANSGDTDGTLSFSLTCLNSKFIINGQMSGLASGEKPFEAILTGTYNPSTKNMEGTIPEGTLMFPDMFDVVVNFEGELGGFLQPDGTFAGTYDIVATSMTSSLLTLGPDDYDASSNGTWQAAPAP